MQELVSVSVINYDWVNMRFHLTTFIILSLLVFLLASTHVFAAATVTFTSTQPYQGDTVMGTVRGVGSALRSATFGGEQMAVFNYKNADRVLVGIAAVKPAGVYTLKLNFADGSTLQRKLTVRAKKFRRVVIGIPEQVASSVTTSTLSDELAKEKKNLESTLAVRTANVYFTTPFGLPLYDNRKVVSSFGEVRNTGGTIWRHLGTDFDARRGAMVAAINNGVVSKAYNDTIYGNTIIIDHGQGIFSMYLHLDKFEVAEGETVKKGRIIGRVGMTGYATGPHLHLTIKANGVSIDSLRFVAAFR